MPKVVSSKGLTEFVESGTHQTIDAKSQKAPEPTAEVKEAVAQAEAASAAEISNEPEETGLEPGDEDLAERARTRIAKKHREMKQADALAKKLRAELDDTENFSKTQYQRAIAAEEEAARLKVEIESLRGSTPKETTGALQSPDANDPIFRNEKGEFDLKKYEEARDKYVLARFKQEQAAERATADREAKLAAFNARLERAREKYPDFKEVVGAADVQVPPYIQQYMVESDYGGDLGYFFAKNRAEFDRISRLSPIKAIAEIGKIEAQWEKPEPEVKQPVAEVKAPKPSAPAPITPLLGSGNAGVNTDPAKMSPKELLAYTREREAAKRRARYGG
jgi:hypothetical protein